ncbi:hypothetical protein TCAL_03954 [Tigriopus californicus]|uniref:Transcription initiation factor TFIID subunit 9 n=2 Tax=Tigriopus californicus TaxID=6832 RepID=A0A553P2X1_TIGCA|nr:hypothetical protein TCAL_03954 [Tigriopus californicus]|eukprot:TCALIF_03954-PA protein Name:"Similar to TAF9 Transcription initiation factor TFIID subunit 9 (Homo sapiens)" AED:0.10 eAED:0.10 QI:0/-1/0/1/-1/1/1/0/252
MRNEGGPTVKFENGRQHSSAHTVGPALPKDGQVMAAILKDMGILDYEAKVINQLLEYSYRYVTDVLQDAKIVSGHAKKKVIDVEDVKLAVQMYSEQNMTAPLSRELLLDAARVKNRQPLPIPRPSYGLRLPPDRHCLTACNYRMKFKPKGRTPAAGGYGKAGAAQAKMVLPQTQGGAVPFTVMKGAGGGGVNPMFKINAADPSGAPAAKFQMGVPAGAVGGNQTPAFKIQINPLPTPPSGVKRKADDMDISF